MDSNESLDTRLADSISTICWDTRGSRNANRAIICARRGTEKGRGKGQLVRERDSGRKRRSG